MYTVYSIPNCSYCDQAKALLESKNIPFKELILDVGQIKIEGQTYVTVQQLNEVIPSARTVPQILHNGEIIGGHIELQQYVGGA